MAHLGKGSLRQMFYAPDGSQFALVTSLGVYIYEAKALAQKDYFPADSANYAVTFSPDWKWMAWGQGAEVRLLRLPSGELVHTLQTQQGTQSGGLFSPDGRFFASLITPPGDEVYNKIVEIWQTSDWTLRNTWDLGAIDGLAFSPDGSTLSAWNAFRMQGIHRWESKNGRALPGLDGIQALTVALSPDGETMATGELDGTLQQRRVSDGTSLRKLEGHTGSVTLVAFSPDGASLFSAAQDGSGRLWRAADGKLAQTFDLDLGRSTLAVFSPDQTTLALGSASDLKFFRLPDGSLLGSLEGFTSGVRRLALSPDGKTVAVLSGEGTSQDSSLSLWSASGDELQLTAPGYPAFSLAYSPDGTRLALGMWDGKIMLLQLNQEDPQSVPELDSTLEGPPAGVLSVAFSPDGSLLASGSLQDIRLWRLSDKKLLHSLPVSSTWVESLAFSPTGDHLASFSQDGIIRLWKTSDGELERSFPSGVTSWSGSLAFSAEGDFLVLGAHNRIIVWRVSDGQVLQDFTLDAEEITSLALSPDSSLLACGLSDSTIQVLSVSDSRLLKTLPGHTNRVSGVTFSPDGSFLVSGSGDGTIRLWEISENNAEK